MELLFQPRIGRGRLQWVQILPLKIFDERDLQELFVGALLPDDDGDPLEAGLACGPPAPFPRDDLELLAARDHYDRLHDSLLADRGGELREPLLPELAARLKTGGDKAVDRHLALECSPGNIILPGQ